MIEKHAINARRMHAQIAQPHCVQTHTHSQKHKTQSSLRPKRRALVFVADAQQRFV